MPKTRCAWVTNDPLYQQYHDEEWGRPVYSGRQLFEFLVLEGQQAGLSWITILKKREHYRRVFCQFDPEGIVAFTQLDFDRLMQDAGIVRNRRKIASVIQNAKAYLRLADQGVDFSEWIWQFVGGEPQRHCWQSASEVPVLSAESKRMSTELKKAGFSFVGPTICYAFMQAVGMVWDHTADCFLSDAPV